MMCDCVCVCVHVWCVCVNTGPHAHNYGELQPGRDTNSFPSLSFSRTCLHFFFWGLSTLTASSSAQSLRREYTHTEISECKSLHLVTDELYISLPASWCLRDCWTQSGWQIHVCPSHSFPCPVNKSHSLRTLPIKGLIVRPIKHLIVFHFHGQFHVMLDESIQTLGAAIAGSSNQAFEDVLCVL